MLSIYAPISNSNEVHAPYAPNFDGAYSYELIFQEIQYNIEADLTLTAGLQRAGN